MEFGQESRIKTPCSGLPRHPSLPPQSYDKQNLSEIVTFVFPWKEQTGKTSTMF